MKTYEEWIKEKEPQYYEDLTYCERDFYKTRYALEQKIEVLEGQLERIRELVKKFPMLVFVHDQEMCEGWLQELEKEAQS